MSADDMAMTPHEFREALQLTRSTFYKYQAMNRFARFQLAPRIGPRRYSRALVREYLERKNAPAARPSRMPAAYERQERKAG